MNPTIKDIAQRANVSYATVSRALNNKPFVKEATRRRVLSLAKELNYTPNALARGLVKKETRTLGLIIPDITNPFYPEVAQGIQEGAGDSGFSVFLCNTNWDHDQELHYLNLLEEKRVDGIILAPIENQVDVVEPHIRNRIPVVYLDKAPRKTRNSYVMIDNVRGGFLATHHLIEQGYDTIGFIGAAEDSLTIDDRLKGYRMAMEQNRLKVHDDFVRFGNYRQVTGYTIIQSMIGSGRYPRAVFAENDLIALGVMQGAREAGLKVPEDIAVIGFDDIPFASFPEVQLSTIRQPKHQMGRTAVEIILQQIKAGNGGPTAASVKRVLLEPELVVRRSSRSR